MTSYDDLHRQMIESEFSHLASMVSLSAEELDLAEKNIQVAKMRLSKVQQALELHSISLGEPLILD